MTYGDANSDLLDAVSNVAVMAILQEAGYHLRCCSPGGMERCGKNVMFIVKKDESIRRVFASSLFMARDGGGVIPEIAKLSNRPAIREP